MLEKESTYKDKAEGSSNFVLKLGLSSLECCFLMNGLVYDEVSEVSHPITQTIFLWIEWYDSYFNMHQFKVELYDCFTT